MCPDDVPLIVVGGGSALCGESLTGVSRVVRPPFAEVANAVGAAIPQVLLPLFRFLNPIRIALPDHAFCSRLYFSACMQLWVLEEGMQARLS